MHPGFTLRVGGSDQVYLEPTDFAPQIDSPSFHQAPDPASPAHSSAPSTEPASRDSSEFANNHAMNPREFYALLIYKKPATVRHPGSFCPFESIGEVCH